MMLGKAISRLNVMLDVAKINTRLNGNIDKDSSRAGALCVADTCAVIGACCCCTLVRGDCWVVVARSSAAVYVRRCETSLHVFRKFDHIADLQTPYTLCGPPGS